VRAAILLLVILWPGNVVSMLADGIEVCGARAEEGGNPTLQVVDVAESEKRIVELKQWMVAYAEWKKWIEKWRNRPQRSWFGFRERRQRPDPPAWLFEDCNSFVVPEGLLGEACQLLTDWQTDYATARLTDQRVKARVQREAPTKTVWWEHIHLDMLWPMTQSGSSAYGVVGVHATIEVAGRFQVFVAPGAIVMNLPNGRNSRDWQPAADWGVAYRLFDFKFPGTRQLGRLHLNLAKAWIFTGEQRVVQSSINLAGFSLTFPKPPSGN
jgi:hypothetical protein